MENNEKAEFKLPSILSAQISDSYGDVNHEDYPHEDYVNVSRLILDRLPDSILERTTLYPIARYGNAYLSPGILVLIDKILELVIHEDLSITKTILSKIGFKIPSNSRFVLAEDIFLFENDGYTYMTVLPERQLDLTDLDDGTVIFKEKGDSYHPFKYVVSSMFRKHNTIKPYSPLNY